MRLEQATLDPKSNALPTESLGSAFFPQKILLEYHQSVKQFGNRSGQVQHMILLCFYKEIESITFLAFYTIYLYCLSIRIQIRPDVLSHLIWPRGYKTWVQSQTQTRMNQIWPIGTEIWFRTDKKCRQTDVMDRSTHRRRQNYTRIVFLRKNRCLPPFDVKSMSH